LICRLLIYFLGLISYGQMLPLADASWEKNEYISLCYHDVPLRVDGDPYAVDLESLVDQIEYLLRHEYNFISFQDVIDANKGLKNLPSKAVLMTFDDGYESFHDNILPILELYRVPAVFAIVSSWIQQAPKAPLGKEKLYPKIISLEKLKRVAKSPLVEISCHSHNMHKAVQLNRDKNTAASIPTRQYLGLEDRFETFDEYHRRLKNDLQKNIDFIVRELGLKPRIMVWPYGKYNRLAVETAKELGLAYHYTLNKGENSANQPDHTKRKLIVNNPNGAGFSLLMQTKFYMDYRKTFYFSNFNTNALAWRKSHLDSFVESMFKLKPSYVVLDYVPGDLQFLSHSCRALNMRDMSVLISLSKNDRAKISDLAQLLDLDGLIFKDYIPLPEEVLAFKYYRPKAIVIGAGGDCDYQLCYDDSELDQKSELLKKKIFFSDNESRLLKSLSLGVKYIASDKEYKCLSNKVFPMKGYFKK
jgi:peptidoglycan/xylan/chitin deacetylase (PgdA/CDA1 family)